MRDEYLWEDHVIRKLFYALAVASLAACAQRSADTAPPASPEAMPLEPLVPVTVTVLNPWLPSDSLVLAEASERAEVRRVSVLRWPASERAGNGRTLRDVMDIVDTPGNRAYLTSCVGADVRGDEVVVVRLQVSSEGTVLAGSVALSTIRDQDLISCLVQSVFTWNFGSGDREQRFDVPLAILRGPGAGAIELDPDSEPARSTQ